jgi:hypothetical protein
LPSHKALLRLRHYHEAARSANGGNAAAHLTNFALHAVARRSSVLPDPRMRSLRSVGHLQVTNHGCCLSLLLPNDRFSGYLSGMLCAPVYVHFCSHACNGLACMLLWIDGAGSAHQEFFS